MTPLEIACRVCDSQAWEACRVMDNGMITMISIVTGYHAERFEDAAAMTKGDAVTKSEFDAAVVEKL